MNIDIKKLAEMVQNYDATINHLHDKINQLTEKVEALNIVKDKLSYSVKEASNATGLKATTIRTYFQDGKLTGSKAGKNILIDADSLKALIKLNNYKKNML